MYYTCNGKRDACECERFGQCGYCDLSPYEQGYEDGNRHRPSQIASLDPSNLGLADAAYQRGHDAGKQNRDEITQYHLDGFAAGLL